LLTSCRHCLCCQSGGRVHAPQAAWDGDVGRGIPWFPVLLLFSLALTILSKTSCELGDLLTVKWVAILITDELRLVLVLLVQLLVPLKLLARLVPGTGPLDLQTVDVGIDGLDVVFVHKCSLVKPPEKPHLYLSLLILFTHNLRRPIGKAFLLGIHNIVRRAARFSEPVLIPPCVREPVAVPTKGHLPQVISAVPEHLPGRVRHGAVHAVVDDHVVHDVLNVRLKLLDSSVLLCLTLTKHLIQVNLTF
jgi:hypothetical protein